MKILLINPPDPYTKKGSKHYPLGLGYLATVLNQKGKECRILDLAARQGTLEESIKTFQPSVIGISVLSTTLPEVRNIVSLTRSIFNGYLIAGGAHATMFPREMILEGFDFVVRGDGEQTLQDLVENLETPRGVNGIVYKEDNQIIENPPRGKIQSLDNLPHPDRELYDLKLYKKHIVMGTRGCSFNCKFCCNWQINGKGIRKRSPKNVLEELKYLFYEYNAKEIFLADDNFGAFRRDKLELCDLISHEGIDINWATQIRVDSVDDILLSHMKKAGCNRIYFGVESGSQAILDGARKGINVNQSKNAIALAKNEGFTIKIGIIIGLPGSYNQNLESLEFVKETLPDEVSVHHFVPFPGTEYWKNASEYGIRITDKSDFGSLYYHTIPKNLEFDYISRNQIIELFNLFDTELRSFGYVSPNEYEEGKKVVTTPLTRNR